MSRRRPDSRTWRTRILKTSNEYVNVRVIKKILKNWRCITNQLYTGFLDYSSFVLPSMGSVALSLWFRATYLFSGQTKLLFSTNPVDNCIILYACTFRNENTYPIPFFGIRLCQSWRTLLTKICHLIIIFKNVKRVSIIFF